MAMADLSYITASLTRASVSIAGKPVLKNVSLTVNKSGIVVVIGPNGASKVHCYPWSCCRLKQARAN